MQVKVAGGIKQDGIVIGNAFDKYGSRNPIVRRLMSGFDAALTELVGLAAPTSIYEVGCGEGYWVLQWNSRGIRASGCDFSSQVIQIARANAVEQGLQNDLFEVASIYDLEAGTGQSDLVVCCEVLEHLDRPEEGLKALQGVVHRHLILSVPREPIWRVLNFARGKYLRDLGNTPGHEQHWSKRSFIGLISRHFDILEVRTPLPWTMLLCRPRT